MKNNIFILLIGLITFCSCVRIKNTPTRKLISVTKNNVNLINGTYCILSNKSDPCYRNTLWKQLFWTDKDSINDWKNSIVKLEVLSKSEIKASLINNNIIIHSSSMKYSIKNGHIYFRRNFRLKGVPFILFTIWQSKCRIALNSDNQLNCDIRSLYGGFLFIFGAETGGQGTFIYIKLSP